MCDDVTKDIMQCLSVCVSIGWRYHPHKLMSGQFKPLLKNNSHFVKVHEISAAAQCSIKYE